jgi:hypothetical protein
MFWAKWRLALLKRHFIPKNEFIEVPINALWVGEVPA